MKVNDILKENNDNDPKKVMKDVTEMLKKELECSASEINRGSCDEWAMEVEKRLPGAEEIDFDLDERYGGHTFIYYDGKYYDSETLEGVKKYKDLPFFKRRREENKNLKEQKAENIIQKGDYFSFNSDINTDKGPCELSQVIDVDDQYVTVKHNDGDEEQFTKNDLNFEDGAKNGPAVLDDGKRNWGLK